MGTWNVRTLYETAAAKSLVEEITKCGIQILAIQETRWKGNSTMRIRDYDFVHSGDQKHFLGVGFVVHKDLRDNIMEFRPISDRVCTIRIKTKFFNLSLINVHAETEEKRDSTKDSFYSILERVYDTTPSNDIKMMLGDLNAKIGRETIYRPIIGKESLHAGSNNNGLRVIDFATSRNMVVSSTYFPRKNIHKGTWNSPDGSTCNQIDHVLIEKRGASSVLQVRTHRKANVESDHFLVGVKFRCRMSSRQTKAHTRCQKFNVDRLKEEGTNGIYQSKLEERLGERLTGAMQD
ncbi:craniofacial development protein 2-like [Temnothorax longispinosus]|uniref:craniofacial development protein 2-like n=1 Tax=Temnothorax longispinosus TaxID=300112 RepID=UPI003A991644